MTTYSLGVTNTSASEVSLAPVAMSMATNYAKTMDEAEVAQLKNKTTKLDQQEMVTYRSRAIKKVGPDIPVYYPGSVPDAVLYSINVQNVLREVRDDGTVIDHPFEGWLTIKHDVTAAWTESTSALQPSWVGQEVRRILGACFTDDGLERFDELAKSALIPDED